MTKFNLNKFENKMLDNIPYFPYLASAFFGIGLAAATGFRVFPPLFAVSLSSYLGWIPMNEHLPPQQVVQETISLVVLKLQEQVL